MFFRVMGGSHVQDGKKYKKGDLVETSLDLCSMFRGKFKRVYKEELAELKDQGVEYVGADNKPDIPKPEDVKPVETSTSEKTETKQDTSTQEPVKPTSEHGKDVTSEFPTADKAGLLVFEKSKWYTVVDKADNQVLNEKKLRKAEVEDFVEQYEPQEDVDGVDEEFDDDEDDTDEDVNES